MNRRQGLLCLCACLSLMTFMTAFAKAADAKLLLVQEREARAAILLAKDAPKNLHQAAKQLVDYIERSTGAVVPVVHDPDDNETDALIVLGDHPRIDAGSTDDLVDDGFEIRFTNARTVAITSPTALGVEFGVYDFLERYVGVRWLFPGELGEHVPEHDVLSIPLEEVRSEPAFLGRSLGAPGMHRPASERGSEAGTWAI